ncbi:hypothetical protein [Niallia sp. MER 6]|uniref:hypothetical protein n=1 Tax=Niallia sp. MER 6 TaxID=2939567 RepID=UPI0020425268|nr:hypothetical protein [Niallia sp. MER 6]MCM3033181.1 hypothetical protein [Niallia sp. MER 6]
MKKMIYQNVKGTQDYLPEKERLRRDIRRTLEDIFIREYYKIKDMRTSEERTVSFQFKKE